MLYSTSTRGFYPEEIQYQNPPADLIEVTDDDYKAAMTLAIGETLDVVNGKLVIVSSPLPSPDQLEVQFTAAIQHRLDDFARTRNYDSILSACTYATSTVPKFKAEGQACVNLRDTTWAAAYAVLTDVQESKRPMPSGIADIEADLPTLVWPA
jgi:hypothetical protein